MAALLSAASGAGKNVVVDSLTNAPLPMASISHMSGRTHVRCVGYMPKTVDGYGQDTIRLVRNRIELPEVVIPGKRTKVLHMLGFAREYSTLTTYSDTVFLFREKIVDFVVAEEGMKFKGWRTPRILASKSYFRFTGPEGLDSVSDRYARHFSWSDWVGLTQSESVPHGLRTMECGTDTVMARYGASKVWNKNGERIAVKMDVLSDSLNRLQFPLLKKYIDDEQMDFHYMNVDYLYNGVDFDIVNPEKLTSMSFRIKSKGRGDDDLLMFKTREPAYVDTYSEIYILDREYITPKEAEKWRSRVMDWSFVQEYLGDAIPERDEEINGLIARVEAIDSDRLRTDTPIDRRYIAPHLEQGRENFKFLNRLKLMLGAHNPFHRTKNKWLR